MLSASKYEDRWHDGRHALGPYPSFRFASPQKKFM